MLIVGLLFGYGADATAGLSLRPWISVPSLATGALLAVVFAGGVESMLCRY